MRIGSILENQTIEKRIAITPEIVKKYISLGVSGLPQSAAGMSTKIGTAVTPGIFMPQKNEAMTFS